MHKIKAEWDEDNFPQESVWDDRKRPGQLAVLGTVIMGSGFAIRLGGDIANTGHINMPCNRLEVAGATIIALAGLSKIGLHFMDSSHDKQN